MPQFPASLHRLCQEVRLLASSRFTVVASYLNKPQPFIFWTKFNYYCLKVQNSLILKMNLGVTRGFRRFSRTEESVFVLNYVTPVYDPKRFRNTAVSLFSRLRCIMMAVMSIMVRVHGHRSGSQGFDSRRYHNF